MTNEQHIENLKKLKSFHNGSYGADIDRAIKALEQEPSKYAVDREQVNDILGHCIHSQEDYYLAIKMLNDLSPVNPQKWIPVKWHNITEEEREREGYPEEWLTYMDCKMPDDGQEILITTKKGYVEKDICYYDDCYSLDSGYDWIDDVIAWMSLPEPYNADKENKE